MIANALRARIATYAVDMKRSNPIFYKAEDGTLTSTQIARYLANVHHLLLHTPIYLTRAQVRALAVGNEALARHYEDKRGEEAGHEAWAEHDIARVTELLPAPVNRDVAPAVNDLVAYIARIIEEDPCLYLAYILFVEQLTVMGGPEWLRLLEERCGIPRSSMTVVGKHAELDREHVEEALDCIDALVGDPRRLPRMREVIETSIALFDRFCIQVTEVKHDGARPGSPLHSSAA
jgi:pyrroloquinoline quinone (PQQ) biosynthesis protein C